MLLYSAIEKMISPRSPILYILLTLISVDRVSANATNSYQKCLERPWNIVEKAQFFRGESCYFIVPNATQRANQQTTGRGTVFNLAIARNICAQHNATLPIINTKRETAFLSSFAVNWKRVALALECGSYEDRKWDDNKPVIHRPNKITQRTRFNYSTFYGVFFPQSPLREWQLVETGSASPDLTHVICEQPNDPDLDPIDNCVAPKNATFQGTIALTRHQSPQYFCLFIVRNATELANSAAPTKGKFIFEIKYAHGICKLHNGILPVIRSASDQQRIIEFHRKHFPNIKRVALGLHYDRPIPLTWDDSTNVTYLPTHFIKLNSSTPKYTSHVFLLVDEKDTWIEETIWDETPNKTAIICQQTHDIVLARAPGDPAVVAPTPKSARKISYASSALIIIMLLAIDI